MGLVAAEESRMGAARCLHAPPRARHGAPVLSCRPMGNGCCWWKWMTTTGCPAAWFPMDGSSQGRQVGPPGAGCTFGAWSPDGKWMYLTSNAGGANHIWRQRFPDGQPEQITSGPTEEEGIAMAPDGRSFVTAVALQSSSLGFTMHAASGRFRCSKATPPTRSSRRMARSFATGS